jgi:hypothetical protein
LIHVDVPSARRQTETLGLDFALPFDAQEESLEIPAQGEEVESAVRLEISRHDLAVGADEIDVSYPEARRFRGEFFPRYPRERVGRMESPAQLDEGAGSGGPCPGLETVGYSVEKMDAVVFHREGVQPRARIKIAEEDLADYIDAGRREEGA